MPQSTSANAALKRLRRNGATTRNTPAKTNPALVHSKLCNAADGAVVVIVSDALPRLGEPYDDFRIHCVVNLGAVDGQVGNVVAYLE